MGPWPWMLIVMFDARSVGPNRVIAIVIAMGKGLEGVDRRDDGSHRRSSTRAASARRGLTS